MRNISVYGTPYVYRPESTTFYIFMTLLLLLEHFCYEKIIITDTPTILHVNQDVTSFINFSYISFRSVGLNKA